jgi:hypothetical protein
MKLGLVPVGLAFIVATSAFACANAANSNPGNVQLNSDAGDAAPVSSEESPDDPPHALGIITLGTIHAATSTTSTPSLAAAFVPDSTAALDQQCGKDVDGCRILAKPDCGGSDGGFGDTGCASNEVCTLDENCESVCEQVPSCTTTCAEDEVCQLVGIKSKCVAKVEFTAGTITLSGDGMSKTVILRPPYGAKSSITDESPFVPGEKIAINATGADDVGIDKFTDSFTATTFIEPKPALNKQLDQETVFESTDSIPIAWKAGEDEVQITVTGNKGTATCKVDDSAGTFDITRKVFRQVYADDGTSSTPSASFSITRARTELKKDKKTVGALEDGDLPPVAFLRLVTQSTETFTAQGCPAGEKLCSTSGSTPACVSVLSDTYNCGDCGKVCTSGTYCYSGICE